MSAFIVGHDHINALVSWAVDNQVTYFHPGFSNPLSIDRRTATEIGRILLHENERSVRYRYPNGAPEDLPGTSGERAETYVFRARGARLSPVGVIKAVHCLEYQSCEHDGWRASVAFSICQDIKEAATYRLPGYDAADWAVCAD
jgi:hypothetical protein